MCGKFRSVSQAGPGQATVLAQPGAGLEGDLGPVPPDFARYAYDIANIAFKANPRRIKRLLNSFLVLRNIIDKRAQAVDYRLLAALIGFQLRWPQRYQEFVRAAEESQEQPHEVLRMAERMTVTCRITLPNSLLTTCRWIVYRQWSCSRRLSDHHPATSGNTT